MTRMMLFIEMCSLWRGPIALGLVIPRGSLDKRKSEPEGVVFVVHIVVRVLMGVAVGDVPIVVVVVEIVSYLIVAMPVIS